MTAYLVNVLIALDQLLNVALCCGEPDETMSSNSYRMHRDGKPWGFMCPVIDTLFFWQRGPAGERHCQMAYESERERSQLPPEFRKP